MKRYLAINSSDPYTVVGAEVVNDVADEDIIDLPSAAEDGVYVLTIALIPQSRECTLVDLACVIR